MSLDGFTRQVLRDLTLASARWALLQMPPEDLGLLADCDIACDASGPELLRRLGKKWTEAGIYPIVHTFYDIGRGDAIWLWSESEDLVLHLDVLSDPMGMGRLGIVTGDLLLEATTIDDLVIADSDWQNAYRLSKDLAKGRRALVGADSIDLNSRAMKTVFGAWPWPGFMKTLASWRRSRAARRYLRLRVFAARLRRNGPIRLATERLKRLLRRVTHRSGRWVHVHGSGAQTVAFVLSKTLGKTLHVRSEPLKRPLWRFLQARFLTLRPVVFITWTEDERRLRTSPDARVQAPTVSGNAKFLAGDVMRQLSAATNARIS